MPSGFHGDNLGGNIFSWPNGNDIIFTKRFKRDGNSSRVGLLLDSFIKSFTAWAQYPATILHFGPIFIWRKARNDFAVGFQDSSLLLFLNWTNLTKNCRYPNLKRFFLGFSADLKFLSSPPKEKSIYAVLYTIIASE